MPITAPCTLITSITCPWKPRCTPWDNTQWLLIQAASVSSELFHQKMNYLDNKIRTLRYHDVSWHNHLGWEAFKGMFVTHNSRPFGQSTFFLETQGHSQWPRTSRGRCGIVVTFSLEHPRLLSAPRFWESCWLFLHLPHESGWRFDFLLEPASFAMYWLFLILWSRKPENHIY